MPPAWGAPLWGQRERQWLSGSKGQSAPSYRVHTHFHSSLQGDPARREGMCNGAMVRMLVRIGAKQGAGPGWLGVEGVWGWQARQEWGGPRGLPGRGSRPPGGLSWGRQGSGGGGRQCRPRGRCGPWRLPGTSACRSQSAVTQEEGRERVTGETRGGTQDGRRDQNVIIRCLSPGSGCPRSEPPFGHHPLPGWCGH